MSFYNCRWVHPEISLLMHSGNEIARSIARKVRFTRLLPWHLLPHREWIVSCIHTWRLDRLRILNILKQGMRWFVQFSIASSIQNLHYCVSKIVKSIQWMICIISKYLYHTSIDETQKLLQSCTYDIQPSSVRKILMYDSSWDSGYMYVYHVKKVVLKSET